MRASVEVREERQREMSPGLRQLGHLLSQIRTWRVQKCRSELTIHLSYLFASHGITSVSTCLGFFAGQVPEAEFSGSD